MAPSSRRRCAGQGVLWQPCQHIQHPGSPQDTVLFVRTQDVDTHTHTHVTGHFVTVREAYTHTHSHTNVTGHFVTAREMHAHIRTDT